MMPIMLTFSESITFMRFDWIISIKTNRDLRWSVMAMSAGALRADGADLIGHRDGARLLEDEGAGDRLALLQGALQTDQHDMDCAGLQLDGSARRDDEPALDRPHTGDAVDVAGLMQLEAAGDGRRAADQPVRRAAAIDDAHVAAADLGATGRRPRPRRLDHERSGLVGLLRQRGRGRKEQGSGHRCSDELGRANSHGSRTLVAGHPSLNLPIAA